MKTFQALNHLTAKMLIAKRSELYRLYTDPSLTEEVTHAAGVLHNFYGAEIDARMSRGQQ